MAYMIASNDSNNYFIQCYDTTMISQSQYILYQKYTTTNIIFDTTHKYITL